MRGLDAGCVPTPEIVQGIRVERIARGRPIEPIQLREIYEQPHKFRIQAMTRLNYNVPENDKTGGQFTLFFFCSTHFLATFK